MNGSKQETKKVYRLLLIAAAIMALVPLGLPLLGPGGDQSQLAGESENPLAMHDNTRNLPEDGAGKQLLDITSGTGSLRVFGRVIQAASDAELIQIERPFTLFMPVDEAFSSMTEEQLSTLINDSNSLRSFVETYIVPGHVSATDLMAGTKVVSLAGDEIATQVGSEVQVNEANVIATEVAQNGVIHYVDRLF